MNGLLFSLLLDLRCRVEAALVTGPEQGFLEHGGVAPVIVCPSAENEKFI